jgi:hypothetical protein
MCAIEQTAHRQARTVQSKARFQVDRAALRRMLALTPSSFSSWWVSASSA